MLLLFLDITENVLLSRSSTSHPATDAHLASIQPPAQQRGIRDDTYPTCVVFYCLFRAVMCAVPARCQYIS
jgi:hypothetical protein